MEEIPQKHIGIQSKIVQKQVYNTIYCQLDAGRYLIINHGQDLLVYDQKTRKILKHRNNNNSNTTTDPIIKAIYSKRYRAIFLMRKSQFLDVYSQQLIELNTKISIKNIRHCIDIKFIDNLTAFLVLQSECLKLVYVQINCNHLKSLFKNNYEFECKELGPFNLPSSYFLEYSNSIIFCDKFLILHNSSDAKIIKFYECLNIPKNYSIACNFQSDASTFQLKARQEQKNIILIKSICQAPQKITKILFYQKISLVVCGTTYGKILLYKINFSIIMATVIPTNITQKVHINHKIAHLQFDQIHTKQKQKSYKITILQAKQYLSFKIDVHNFREVSHICFHSAKIIFTTGADDYLQVISLEHMASIQRFRLSSKVFQSDLVFISRDEFLAVTNDQGFEKNLYSYKLCLDYKLKWHHKSTVIQTIYNDNNIITVMTDNSLSWVNCDQQNKKVVQIKNDSDLVSIQNQPNSSKEDQKQIMQAFVPKSCKTILCITKNPYCSHHLQQEYWLLTNDSQIHKYKIKQIPPTKSRKMSVNIDQQQKQSLQIHSFIDKYNHQTHQKILLMQFVDFVPIQYDSDIKQKYYKPNIKKPENLKPIAFGCLTGQILICPTYNTKNPLDLSCIQRPILRIRSFGEPVFYFSMTKIFAGTKKTINLSNFTVDDLGQKIEGSQNSLSNQQQKQQKQVYGQSRLLVYSSKNQIVIIQISNYQAPLILYKTLISSTNPLVITDIFSLKQLSHNFCGIISGNMINIIFAYDPDYRQNSSLSFNPSQLCLYSNSSIIHESNVTALSYCCELSFMSGDQNGKIVIWTIKGQVLSVLEINQDISIDICFYFYKLNKIIYGYNSKIFESAPKMSVYQKSRKIKNQNDSYIEMLQDQRWMKQSIIVLKKGGNSGSKQVGLKMMAKLMQKNTKKQDSILPLNKTSRHRKFQTIQKSSGLNLPLINKTNPIRPHRQKNKSHQELGVPKIKMLQSRLDLIEKSQPSIELMPSQQIFGSELYSQFHKRRDLNKPKKKKPHNKNKVYQYLFHFPSSGLYQQLVHKDMLQ